MMRTTFTSLLRNLALITALSCWLTLPATAAAELDTTPRIAVMSAFGAELDLLLGQLTEVQKYSVNGVTFSTGKLEAKPVVLFRSGVSMTNAAMTTQLALDRFHVTHIVFSGIAGGVNPSLRSGDVTVAQQWTWRPQRLRTLPTAMALGSLPFAHSATWPVAETGPMKSRFS